jgi:peptide-methionine (S)-S-oxide reductase
MAGVVHTRVGYAGGTTPDPTYRSIGDHAESVQIDFDPEVVSYDELLAVFWSSHRPTTPAYSRQYASMIFVENEDQAAAARSSLARVGELLGPVATEIVSDARFYVAEDYHQKYRLRGDRTLMPEFARVYPDSAEFTQSTAAARVNGYRDGYGTHADLDAEIGTLGLSEAAQAHLRTFVSAGRSRQEAC